MSRGVPLNRRRALRSLIGLSVAVLLFAASSPPAAGSADRPSGRAEVLRRVHDDGPPIGVPGRAPSTRAPATAGTRSASTSTTVRIVTVDSHAYTGAENVIWARNRRTVFVAYKRFLRSPYDPGGDIVPATLRVAKTSDGGKTWTSRVVDPSAEEPGDVLDQSVSIGGDGSTVYVAYLAGSSLKVAKSVDGGATWSIQTLATDGTGEFNAIDVVDANTVLIAAERPSYTDEALRLFSTTDGGTQWDDATIDTFGWYTALDSAPSGRIWVGYYHPGDTDLYAASSDAPAGPWAGTPIAGAPADGHYTGLGASLAVSREGDVYVSYEDFYGGSTVTVSKSTDDGASWSAVPVDEGGWNTAINVLHDRTLGTTDAFVAYWRVRWKPAVKGRLRLATSLDGAATWSVLTVPEPRYVEFYLDLAAPAANVQYLSYQAEDATTGSSILRVARMNATA